MTQGLQQLSDNWGNYSNRESLSDKWAYKVVERQGEWQRNPAVVEKRTGTSVSPTWSKNSAAAGWDMPYDMWWNEALRNKVVVKTPVCHNAAPPLILLTIRWGHFKQLLICFRLLHLQSRPLQKRSTFVSNSCFTRQNNRQRQHQANKQQQPAPQHL